MRGRMSFGRAVAIYVAVLVVLVTALVLGLTGGSSFDGAATENESAELGGLPIPEEPQAVEPRDDPAGPAGREPDPVIEVTRPIQELDRPAPSDTTPTSPPVPQERPQPVQPSESAPAASVVASGQAPGPGDFTIQVAAHSSEEEARRTVARLQVAGFDAVINRPGPGSSDQFYRVWVGRYGSRDEARATENALKQADFATYVRRVE